MEPGHEDREYIGEFASMDWGTYLPQWSPVMKTGNTRLVLVQPKCQDGASMEPGHEDREYLRVALGPEVF